VDGLERPLHGGEIGDRRDCSGQVAAILSRLLTKFETSGNAKTLALITQISPAG